MAKHLKAGSSVRVSVRRARPAARALLAPALVDDRIRMIRGERVLLDSNLAGMYGGSDEGAQSGGEAEY